MSAGPRSQLAVKLYLQEEGTLGTVNFYSTSTDEVDPGAPDIAALFATHAAIALGRARQRENLSEALHSRTVIGQASGILMERYQINDERASASCCGPPRSPTSRCTTSPSSSSTS